MTPNSRALRVTSGALGGMAAGRARATVRGLGSPTRTSWSNAVSRGALPGVVSSAGCGATLGCPPLCAPARPPVAPAYAREPPSRNITELLPVWAPFGLRPTHREWHGFPTQEIAGPWSARLRRRGRAPVDAGGRAAPHLDR